MKKFIICLFLALSVIPIKYERDINNDKIITQIGKDKVKYERDINGNKIPTKIGNKKIKYERDINGNKIPVGIEK